MKFSRFFLNRLQNQPPAHDTVVVIDVLRSFTTAAVAMDRGAAAIYPVEGVSAGIVLTGLLDNAVSVGAIAGGDPAPGFEYGNSPAALLEAELTLPEVAQTVILTRYGHNSPMPAGEELGALASHRATLAIHLGVQHLPRIIDELLPYYGADCPIAVVHRASWPDQDWVRGTLADIEARVAVKGFRRTALILVGRVLATDDFAQSALYAEATRHLYRLD